MTQSQEAVVISTVMTREHRDELERRAVKADRTVSAEVRRVLREYLERDGNEKGDER
jgi:hypothetical protein